MKQKNCKQKYSIYLGLTIILAGLTTAVQPEIVEIKDNFGNNYDFSEYDSTGVSTSAEENILVTDETRISLCVTEVNAENPENLNYNWEFISSGSSISDFKEDNNKQGECGIWELNREDFKSRWTFRVTTDNGDEIQPNGDNDYGAGIIYRNLELSGSSENLSTKSYNNILITEDEYNELKESHSKESVELGSGNVSKTSDDIGDLRSEIESKNEEIERLRSKIEDLQAEVEKLEEDKPTRETENKGILDNIFGIFN